MTRPTVVHHARWAAVKHTVKDGMDSYDVWLWNLEKLKWVRKSNTACGFGELEHAAECADEFSRAVDAMLAANRNPPEPLT